jgi:hypothetical protein
MTGNAALPGRNAGRQVGTVEARGPSYLLSRPATLIKGTDRRPHYTEFQNRIAALASRVTSTPTGDLWCVPCHMGKLHSMDCVRLFEIYGDEMTRVK